VQSPVNSGTNPFLASGPVPQQPIVDLFGGMSDLGGMGGPAPLTKASDDLLQLGNPFADMFGAPAAAPPQTHAPAVPPAPVNWPSNGMLPFFF